MSLKSWTAIMIQQPDFPPGKLFACHTIDEMNHYIKKGAKFVRMEKRVFQMDPSGTCQGKNFVLFFPTTKKEFFVVQVGPCLFAGPQSRLVDVLMAWFIVT